MEVLDVDAPLLDPHPEPVRHPLRSLSRETEPSGFEVHPISDPLHLGPALELVPPERDPEGEPDEDHEPGRLDLGLRFRQEQEVVDVDQEVQVQPTECAEEVVGESNHGP